MRINWLKIIGIIGVGYVSVVTILYLGAYWNTIHLFSTIDTKAFAEYGSHIAGIGAVFAFVFAFASFWRIESSNRKKEFETTFFNMLNQFDAIVSQIKVAENNRIPYFQGEVNLKREYSGKAALNTLLEDYLSTTSGPISIDELDEDTDTDFVSYRWIELYNKNLESLPHYFRYYYTLVKFIMKSEYEIDRKFYADLLQAQMSSSEMGLIFYNTFYNDKISSQRGASDFKEWLNDKEISLLENIDSNSVLDVNDLRSKCPDIKFKFDLLAKKNKTMATKIRMGNDEFILYIRKTSDCEKTNDHLGREIWKWLRDNGAKKLFDEKPQPCHWETTGPSIGEKRLPQDATQFEFDRAILPELYAFLDDLKS